MCFGVGFAVNLGQKVWGCEDDGNMGFPPQLASEVCDYAQFRYFMAGIPRVWACFRVLDW